MAFRYRPLLLLPAVAVFIAAAILWGGVVLSKRERWERIRGDHRGISQFSEALEEEILSLESLYQRHLETLSREDLNAPFDLRDAIDSVVGVRQLSTLSPSGKVDLHLLASEVKEDEAEIPLPVYSRDALPPGRLRFFQIESPGAVGSSGWLGTEEFLFYFSEGSDRRTVFLLIEREVVAASIRESLAEWIYSEMAQRFDGDETVSVSVNGTVASAVGENPGEEPDLIRPLGTRFGHWQVQSRDQRIRVVEYNNKVLGGTALLALLIALAGGITFVTLHRALRLAERRVSFVNHVSHELKTPLTNILLNTDLAADGANSEGRKRLAMVQEETHRLARLIDNVLTYSQKDRKPSAPAIGSHAVLPLLDAVVAQFHPLLERRGITITLEGDTTMTALINPDTFTQILGNLLSNVEKYAASGSIAGITAENSGTDVIVRVRDGGPGIPRLERERIFLPFHRIDNRTAEGASGTGLGLSIARDLAKGMGGSLRALPGLGEPGATFELRLPAATVDKVIAFPDSRAS